MLLICCTLYVLYGKYITEENIAHFLLQFKTQMLLAYLIVCVLRGITFIPATPFLFAGILLFGSSPLLLLLIFLTSIFFVSALLFYAARFLNFGAWFEKRYPEKIRNIKTKLNSRYGVYFMMLWAFAPFTPTDVVCYVAGSLRIRFIRFIVPVVLGEGLICAAYIFLFKHYALHLQF